MRIATKILSQLILIITVFTFAISTTGFSFYSHTCSHHNTSSIVISKDDCCSKIEEIKPEVDESCCKVVISEQAGSSCNSTVEGSTCCETDLNYYKLSEWFLESSENQIDFDCLKIEKELPALNVSESEENLSDKKTVDPVFKKPKQRKYRLYHRVKIDPPLI